MNQAQTMNALYGRENDLGCEGWHWVPRVRPTTRQWPVYVPTLSEPWVHVRHVAARIGPRPEDVEKDRAARTVKQGKMTVVGEQIVAYLRAAGEPATLGAISKAVGLPSSYMSGRMTRLTARGYIKVVGHTVVRGAVARLYQIA